jgi:hypothetical protein
MRPSDWVPPCGCWERTVTPERPAYLQALLYRQSDIHQILLDGILFYCWQNSFRNGLVRKERTGRKEGHKKGKREEIKKEYINKAQRQAGNKEIKREGSKERRNDKKNAVRSPSNMTHNHTRQSLTTVPVIQLCVFIS